MSSEARTFSRLARTLDAPGHGIGVWTVQMPLFFGLGLPDVLPSEQPQTA